MAEDKFALREVHWRHVLPWLAIFRSFGIAADFKKLLLAALGVVATSAGWWILANLFTLSGNEDVQRQAELIAHWPWEEGQWETFAVSDNPNAKALLEELRKTGMKLTPADQARIGAMRVVEDLGRSGLRVTPSDRAAIE